jgi:hypothetical protein
VPRPSNRRALRMHPTIASCSALGTDVRWPTKSVALPDHTPALGPPPLSRSFPRTSLEVQRDTARDRGRSEIRVLFADEGCSLPGRRVTKPGGGRGSIHALGTLARTSLYTLSKYLPDCNAYLTRH